MTPLKYLIAFLSIGLTLAGPDRVNAQEEQARERQEIRTQTQEQIKTQEQARERIYGYDLMTGQERNEYREKLRSMNTEEERNAFRAQHHEAMQKRARERNMEIPEDVPGEGMGKHKGKGKGKDMSHGHGKAHGYGHESDSGSGGKGQRKGGK